MDIAGETSILYCFVNGTSEVGVFQWLDEQGSPVTGRGSEISSSSISSGSQLKFSPLRQSHGGTYTCNVTVAGIVRSKSTILSVNGKYSVHH